MLFAFKQGLWGYIVFKEKSKSNDTLSMDQISLGSSLVSDLRSKAPWTFQWRIFWNCPRWLISFHNFFSWSFFQPAQTNFFSQVSLKIQVQSIKAYSSTKTYSWFNVFLDQTLGQKLSVKCHVDFSMFLKAVAFPQLCLIFFVTVWLSKWRMSRMIFGQDTR